MKYRIEEQPDGTHKLSSDSELTNRILGKMLGGAPTEAELQFWMQLQAAEETINQIEASLCVDPSDPKAALAPLWANAAEYVPAIQDVFKLIDEYRANEINPQQDPT